jgi:cellulose synthase (UDP-forming)
MGGQSLHSVTEDYKTGFNALSNGFSTMYFYRSLVYGLAVDDCNGIHRQRTRWATGAMQILAVDNPLCKPGLTFAQVRCWDLCLRSFRFSLTLYGCVSVRLCVCV